MLHFALELGPWSDWYRVFLASLDNPENFVPTIHFGIESQMPWFDVHDALPRVRYKDSPAVVAAWASVGLPVPEPNLRESGRLTAVSFTETSRPTKCAIVIAPSSMFEARATPI